MARNRIMKIGLTHSRTPLRISFTGGGTDLPAFYRKRGGAVISATITCYVDVVLIPRLVESGFKYQSDVGDVEEAATVDQITNQLIGQSLKLVGWDSAHGLEIFCSSGVPFGTGLGSSSACAVGLLHALYTMMERSASGMQLASDACQIEIDLMGKPIGRQDQYIIANGGLRHTTFNIDDTVVSTPIECSPAVLREIEDRLLLFYLGGTRKADSILASLQQSIEQNEPVLEDLKFLCHDLEEVLKRGTNLDEFGEILDYAWQLKRRLHRGITNDRIDDIYQRSRVKGSIGGKLLGAGGTGFLLLFVPPERQAAVCDELQDYRRLHFRFDPIGSRIMCTADR
jgi:D-glycero-alpha-D-manno-heptose-7-phosphate kinase